MAWTRTVYLTICSTIAVVSAAAFYLDPNMAKHRVTESDWDAYASAIATCQTDQAEGAKMVELLDKRYGEERQPADLRMEIAECNMHAAVDDLAKMRKTLEEAGG